MAGVFDRETLLDLIVNVIPLGIILFFVVAFAVVDPFGGDRLGRLLQFGLLVVPFLALAVLTYVSGKVIAADERRAEVYAQGQATMDEASPRHADSSTAADEAEDGTEPPEANGVTVDTESDTTATESADEPAAGSADETSPASEQTEASSDADDGATPDT